MSATEEVLYLAKPTDLRPGDRVLWYPVGAPEVRVTVRAVVIQRVRVTRFGREVIEVAARVVGEDGSRTTIGLGEIVNVLHTDYPPTEEEDF